MLKTSTALSSSDSTMEIKADVPETSPAASRLGHAKDGSEICLDFREQTGAQFLVLGSTDSGKSYLLRKLLELALDADVPILVFDIENEFATLKLHCPDIVVLGGPDATCRLNPDTVGAMVSIIHAAGSSAILQLGEFSTDTREKIVTSAVTALMQAPIGRSRVVAIDEAQHFAAHGSSTVTAAVEDLMSRGRKRGLSTIIATQRYARITPTARTQAKYRFIGRAGDKTDADRAGEELGLNRKAWAGLLALKRGEFFYASPSTPTASLIDVAPTQSPHGLRQQVDCCDTAPVPVEQVIEQLKRLEVAGEGAIAGSPPNPKLKVATRAVEIRPRATAQGRDEGAISDLPAALLHILSSVPEGKLTNEELGLLVRVPACSIRFLEALLNLEKKEMIKRSASSVRLNTKARSNVSVDADIRYLAAKLRMRLGTDQRRIVDVLVAAGHPIELIELADRTGFKPRSTKLKAALRSLSRLGFVSARKGAYTVSKAYGRLMSR